MSATTTTSTEGRLAELGITLPDPPAPLGAYLPAVQTGQLLFLSGMLATTGGAPTAAGVLGAGLDVAAGRAAARAAALNALAVARRHLGDLGRVRRVVRLGVWVAAAPGFKDHGKVADAASELLRDAFGADRLSTRLALGVTSLPLGSPVVLEVILEVTT